MKLGTYTFAERPDRWEIPRAKIRNSVLETFSSAQYFSWGPQIIGRKIPMEWDKMSCDQFGRLEIPYLAETTEIWDPEVTPKIFHGLVTNGPFVAGKTITGGGSGATGTVGTVLGGEKYFEYNPTSGTFTVGENITDNSSPPKSADITSLELVGTYDVRVFDLQGSYIEVAGPNIAAFRQNVRMILLILAVN